MAPRDGGPTMRHHDPTTAASPGSRLVARVPADVRAQLEEVAMILTRLTPAVVGALRRIHPLSTASRLGRLQAHVQTIVGDSPHGTEPVYGLRALRQVRDQQQVARPRG